MTTPPDINKVLPPAGPPEKAPSSFPFAQAILYVLLFVMLMVVMLPLGWMLLTAFKIPGTAFQLRFIPQTTVTWPAQGEAPFLATQVDSEDRLLHFEYDNPRATTATVELREAGADETFATIGMTQGFMGVWRHSASHDFDAGQRIDIRFTPGGEEPTEWIALAVPPNGPLLYPDDPQSLVVVDQDAGHLLARIAESRERQISVRPESSRAILVNGELRTPITVAEGEALAYRLTERVGMGDAFASMYTLDNFRAIMLNPEFNFLRYFWNSLVVATMAAFFTVLICTLAAYAFSVFDFHYREPFFILLLSSMLVPGMIYMVPQFSITLQLGLMNSYTGMVIPHLGNVFGLFLLRQYIDQIPRDLFAAAEIDGANDAQSFRNIVIPVCLPIMVTLFLLVFVTQWSNFLWQLIINTGDSRVLTLPVGLQQFRGQNADEWEKIMAGACFSLIPISILFLSLQKYFLQGLIAGSVKE